MLKGLDEAGSLAGGKVHVDLFKVPHHGSQRNVTKEFFQAVTADQYIISADGKHDNPDTEMIEMLADARGNSDYIVHLTNPVPHALTAFKKAAKKPGRKFKLEVRKDTDLSLRVELGEALKD